MPHHLNVHTGMKPAEIIRNALAEEMIDEDGNPWEMSLLPGLAEDEIAIFENKIGFSLPSELRELFEYTNGMDGGPLAAIDFTSSVDYVDVGYEDLFGREYYWFCSRWVWE